MILLLAAGWAATACQSDGSRPSLLDAPRVLAVRMEPVALPSGATGTVEVLAHDVTGVVWQGCATPWTAQAEPACRTGAWPLGTGAKLTVPVPAGLTTLHLRVDAHGPSGQAQPAIARWSAQAAGSNPEVLVAAVAPTVGLLAAPVSGQLAMRGSTPGGASASATHTWFATAGEFLPWRTRGESATTWSAPTVAGPVTLVCVSRDGLGGVGWHQWSLDVGGNAQGVTP